MRLVELLAASGVSSGHLVGPVEPPHSCDVMYVEEVNQFLEPAIHRICELNE